MKTLLKTLVILLIIAGLAAGGVYGYSRYTLNQPAKVQPVANWLLEYSPNQTYLGGTVISGDSFFLYGEQDVTPLEIYVAEGQSVRAGDPLVRYDTTKDNIDLDEKLLNRQKLYDELQGLYKEYRRFANVQYERTIPTATPTATPTPRSAKGVSAVFGAPLTVVRLGAPVQRALTPTGSGDGRTQGDPLLYELKDGQPVSKADINALKATARERMSTVYARFKNASFGRMDMVVQPGGSISFKVVGQYGKDQANFNKPLSGNGKSPETALTYAYASGEEVPPAFIASLAETARRSNAYVYVKLRSGYLSITMTFDDSGDLLAILPSRAEPTPTPTAKPTPPPTPSPTPTPSPSPTPSATPEGWEEIPETPYVAYDGAGMSRAERMAYAEELAQKIRDGELNYKQLSHDIDRLQAATQQNGVVTSDIDGVVTALKPDARAGDILMEVRSGSGKGVISCMLGETELAKYPVGMELTGFSYDIGENVTARVSSISPMPATDSYSNGGNPNSSGYAMLLEVVGDVELPLYSYVEFTSFQPLSKSGAIYLYEAFVREIDGQDCIFVARDGVLRKEQVHTGRRTMEYIELIGSSLTREDYIAFPYGKTVRDGAAIEITDGEW